MRLEAPAKYYGIASAHFGRRFNVCVLKQEGDNEITKDEDLSWREEGDFDTTQLSAHINRFARTAISIGGKESKLQEDVPFKYSIPILVSLHSTPGDLIDQMISDARLPDKLEREIPTPTSKEEKGQYLLHRKIMHAIDSGQVDDFDFTTLTGNVALPGETNNSLALRQLEIELRSLHQKVITGDRHSMTQLKFLGAKILLQQINSERLNSLGGDLSFIQFSHPCFEYLNLPEVVESMKDVLLAQGLDPDKIDIKFPSDPKNDYYFNVLRPEVERRIATHHRDLLEVASRLHS